MMTIRFPSWCLNKICLRWINFLTNKEPVCGHGGFMLCFFLCPKKYCDLCSWFLFQVKVSSMVSTSLWLESGLFRACSPCVTGECVVISGAGVMLLLYWSVPLRTWRDSKLPRALSVSIFRSLADDEGEGMTMGLTTSHVSALGTLEFIGTILPNKGRDWDDKESWGEQ